MENVSGRRLPYVRHGDRIGGMDNRITVRLPEHVRTAMAQRAAEAGDTLGVYVVKALAEHCGLEVGKRLVGAAALGPEDRSRIGSAGAAARWKSRKRPRKQGRKKS